MKSIRIFIFSAVTLFMSACAGNLKDGVDLGLPSGTIWASCNLGANTPFQEGLYYAWGETKGYAPADRHDFWWDNYLKEYNGNLRHWKSCGTELDPLRNYSIPGSDRLPLEYDAANVALGDGWHIPTYIQFEELISYCDWEWTTIGGTSGYKVKSKVNRNFIFLPANGYADGTMICGADEWGYYMTSTAYSSTVGYERILYFFNGDKYWNFSSRYNGLSIRPVR